MPGLLTDNDAELLAMTSDYRVEVFATGRLIAEHTVEAADALAAINLVEASYGEPPEVEYRTTHHEDGTRETALVVIGWHGYTFIARNTTRMSR
jgi:hypothetical protein